jgi:hypothetical protein
MGVKTVYQKLSKDEWKAEGQKLFGVDFKCWKFVCPSCGVTTEASEWIEANANNMIAFSCIGRTKEKTNDAFDGPQKQPCNYAGGGLIRLNPVTVIEKDGSEIDAFDFYRGGGD